MINSMRQWEWDLTPLGVAWGEGAGAIQVALSAAVLLLAWGLSHFFSRGMGVDSRRRRVLVGRHHWDGVLIPLISVAGMWLLRMLLKRVQDATPFLDLVQQFLLAWLLVSVISRAMVLQSAPSPWRRALSRWAVRLTWVAWLLWALGGLPIVRAELGGVSWTVGEHTWTLLTVVEGGITTSVVLILALWVSSLVESYLLRDVAGGDLSLRKMLANAVRALLVFVGLVLALGAVGINLTALSVLGGALGVGIGFGLQKLAANYVSGFVILGERSVRIGDIVKVDGFEGQVTDIRGRYTVLRAPTGIESIVPNEMLITQRVENLSLADTKVWLSTTVGVAYDSDVDVVVRLLEEAARTQARVLQDPGPHAALQAFGPDALEFTLGFWIADPSNGRLGVLSGVNRAVLAALREHHIEIPYPQRVVHLQGAERVTASPKQGPL